MIVLSLAIQFIAPTWIMPLFNKFTPMEPGELKSAILKYAGSVNFPVTNIFVIDGSKRSSKSNAFFTGFGRNKRIALFDTLIARQSVPEMVAVLAHEVGHYKKKHILQGLSSVLCTPCALLPVIVISRQSRFISRFFHDKHARICRASVLWLTLYPHRLVLSILMQMISRKNEYEADRFAAATIEQPENLVGALKKLATTSLSNLRLILFMSG